MIWTIFLAFVAGIMVYLGTAFFLGSKKASKTPVGAIVIAFFISPWYISIIFTLIGYFMAVRIAKKF